MYIYSSEFHFCERLRKIQCVEVTEFWSAWMTYFPFGIIYFHILLLCSEY